MRLKAVRIIILFSFLQLVLFLPADAAQVGRFLEVEGRVDLLKRGQLPASAVKAGDLLEVEDVVRTKSQSRALIQFVDDTTLVIAPESRVAVSEYVFDAGKSHRRAVVRVLQGLVRAVVPRLFDGDRPNFLMETHTAVMGVRGTEWYAHLLPHATDVYTVAGSLVVRNLDERVPGEVVTQVMQYTRVGLKSAPTPPVAFSMEDLNILKKQLSPGLTPSSGAGSLSGHVSGPLLSSLGDFKLGILTDYRYLDRNFLGSLRDSNVGDRVSVNLSIPPRVASFRSELHFKPGGRNFILDRTIRDRLPINPGIRSFRPDIRK